MDVGWWLFYAVFAVVALGFLGCAVVVALNGLYNGSLLVCRAAEPLVRFGQGRSFKRLPGTVYAGSILALFVVASLGTPNFCCSQTKAKNSGVQANTHQIQMALEQYAFDHDGSYPPSLSELFPKYAAGYPRTPWNTQQEATADIPAGTTPDCSDWRKSNLGPGAAETPRLITHYGAIGYTCVGNSGKHYLLSGTGRVNDNAVIVFAVSNVD